MQSHFFTDTSEVTAEWMTGLLQEGNYLKKTQHITSLEIKPLGQNVEGFSSQMFRVNLSYNEDEVLAPKQLILKFQLAEGPTLEFARITRMYINEGFFFKTMANDLNEFLASKDPKNIAVGVPHCYFADVDSEGRRYTVLMEDLSLRDEQFTTGDNFKGPSDEEARNSIYALAHFHTFFLENTHKFKNEWNWTRGPKEIPPFTDDLIPRMKKCVGEEIFTEKLDYIYKKYLENHSRIQDSWCEGPLSLSHLDFRTDNLFYSPSGKVIIIDFQLIKNAGTVGIFRDVAYFCVLCLSEAQRKSMQEELFRAYYDVLYSHGVLDIDYKTAWNKYRYSVCYLFGLLAFAAKLLDSTDRGRKLLKTWVINLKNTCDELNLLEFIE